MRPASPLTETDVTGVPLPDGSLALPIAKNPCVRPRSVIGAMNTRASRTIVTQSVPKVSSSDAGFARTTAACAHAGMQPGGLHPDAHRAGAGAGGGDQPVELARVFDEAAPRPLTRREIGSAQRDDIDVAFVSR